MNFAGPFDSELTHDSPVSLGGERFAFDSKPGFTQHHASDSHVVIPDAHLLFSGEYTRIGSDLIISGDGQKFVVGNYFKGEARPALVSKDGATLSGHIVNALTGHVHYAQATGAPAASEVIGHVLKMSGSASVIRNGVSVELHIGDAVQKGDVVQTGSDSSIGMTFVDGSAFGMTSNARMVLNEMIYDPNGSSNSSLISLVQGTITFVAGQTAKNGNMRVETPVATMGIRGTAVLVEIGANDGPTKFSVLVEPDGHTGSYNLYDKTTGQLIGTVSQAGQVTFVSVSGIGQPPTAIEQLKTLADQQAEKALIQQVFQLFFPNYNPDNSNPKSQKTGFGSPGDNINPFTFNYTSPDNQPLKIIVIPGVGIDPHTGQPNPPRIFYNTKAQFSADTVTAEQSITSSVKTFKISDVVHIDDPDIGNGPFYDVATPFVAGSAVIKSAVSTNPNLDANFLKQFLHINQQTGEVTFDRLGFNFLGQGETATFMLQVLSQSGPDSALVIIPIVITGDNDVPNDNGVPNGAPTIVLPLSDIVGGVKEDTPVGASSLAKDGTITFRDVDLSDTHTVSHQFTSSISGSSLNPASNPSLPGFGPGAHLGIFTLGPIVEDATDTINTGTVAWHFSLPDNDPTLQSLAEGQTITQVYTITITDVHGALVTQTVTITITGTNDAPVVTGSIDDHPSLAEDGLLSASGVISFKDIDLVDTHVVTQTLTGGSINSALPGFNPAHDPLGTLALTRHEDNTDTVNTGLVDWTFTADNALLQQLAVGQVVSQTYTVTIDDQHGGTPATQTIVITITGANDDAVISVAVNDHDSGAVVEDDHVGSETATGTLSFSDVDLIDTHTITAASVGITLGTLTAVLITDTSGGTGGSLKWTYNVADSAIQYLAAGDTKDETFTISMFDGTSTVTRNVVVTITGTNDAPVVSGVVSDPSAVEDGALRPIDALANASDVDQGAILSVVGVPGVDAPGSLPPGVSYDPVTHTFTLDPGNAAYQHLAAGATTTVTVNYGVSDGIVATPTPASVSWTITGTNDAPVVSGVVSDALAVEDGPGRVLNALANASDIDDGATLSVVNVPGTLPAGVSYDPGTHMFTLDPGNAAYQHLAAGATTTVTVNYGVSDGIVATPTPASVSWTITGTNDAPTVSAALTDTVSEGDTAFTKNLLLNATDVDDGDTLSIINVTYKVDTDAASGTAPAGLSLSGSTLSVDPTDPSFDHLAVGQHTAILVSYDVKDALGLTVHQTETITINGTNDAPTVSAALTDTVSEGDTAFTQNLLLNASDVDDGDTLSIINVTYKVDTDAASGTAPAGVSLSGSTLSVDPTDPSFDHLAVGQHTTILVSYDVKDALGLTVHQTETITINGTNDAPTIVADTAVHLVEATSSDAGTPVSVAALTIADVDGTANYDAIGLLADGWTYNSGADTYTKDGAYGTATLDAAHNLTYALDNNLADSLTSTDHPVETFRVSVIDNHGLTAFTDVSFTVDGSDDPVNQAPALDGGALVAAELGGGTTQVSGVLLSDPGETDNLIFSAAADHGTVTKADGTTALDAPGGVSETLANINGILADGIIYTPDNLVPTDHVLLTITDSHGLSDTLNLVFNQSGTSGATLVGTAGKDIFFATGSPDTFVFAPNSNHDIIMGGFAAGTDKIDLQALTSFDTTALADLLSTADHIGGDTLLHLNGATDTLLLKGVATLNASDFILHA